MEGEKNERKKEEREGDERWEGKEGRNDREGKGERRVQEIWWGRGEERQPKFLHIIFKLFIMDQLLHNLVCENRLG